MLSDRLEGIVGQEMSYWTGTLPGGPFGCTSVDVPSVAPGTLLSRCASDGTTVYTLVLPDTRLDGGLWSLTVQSEDSTPVRPAAILPVLVDGVAATFG